MKKRDCLCLCLGLALTEAVVTTSDDNQPEIGTVKAQVRGDTGGIRERPAVHVHVLPRQGGPSAVSLTAWYGAADLQYSWGTLTNCIEDINRAFKWGDECKKNGVDAFKPLRAEWLSYVQRFEPAPLRYGSPDLLFHSINQGQKWCVAIATVTSQKTLEAQPLEIVPEELLKLKQLLVRQSAEEQKAKAELPAPRPADRLTY